MTRPDAKWRRSTVQCVRLSVPISGWSQQSDAVSASIMSISTTIDVIDMVIQIRRWLGARCEQPGRHGAKRDVEWSHSRLAR